MIGLALLLDVVASSMIYPSLIFFLFGKGVDDGSADTGKSFQKIQTIQV